MKLKKLIDELERSGGRPLNETINPLFLRDTLRDVYQFIAKCMSGGLVPNGLDSHDRQTLSALHTLLAQAYGDAAIEQAAIAKKEVAIRTEKEQKKREREGVMAKSNKSIWDVDVSQYRLALSA